MTDVVCVGILVADAIVRPVDDLPPRGTLGLVDEISLHGGGCALNTASALVRLGLQAAVVGRVGADAFGDHLLDLLDARGVDRRAVVRDPEAPTSASVALVHPDGERTFLHVPGANARLRPEALPSARAVHVAGALVMPAFDGEPTAALLSRVRAERRLTSLAPVWDPTGRWDLLEPSLPHLDLFTPDLAEARAISGEEAPAAAARWLRDRGVREVAITMGAEGCWAAGPEFAGHVPGLAVEAVDGTGAGDAFVAGLLHGRLAGWDLERACRLANAVGALATTAVGAVEGVRSLEETLAFASRSP